MNLDMFSTQYEESVKTKISRHGLVSTQWLTKKTTNSS